MKLRDTLNKGFSLIELVIVIMILSVLGIMTSSYIKTGVELYTHKVNLDKSISSVRFVMERLRREVSNALPNSLVLKNNCLTFTPVINSSFYDDHFPIYPQVADHGFIAPINQELKGTKAVINLLTLEELLTESNKIQTVSHYDLNSGELTFNNSVSFPAPSMTKRIYFIKDNISYCFNDSKLYKRTNNNENILMAENITGKFVNKETTSNVLQVTFNMEIDEQEVFVEQVLRINNKP